MKTSPNLKNELSKAWRLGTSPLRRLPDFLIPGAPKCGTSSLYDLIMLHPRARRGWRKEPTNFLHYPTSSLRSRMNQPVAFGKFLCGEGSVEYFFHPDAPANAASVVPGAALIFLLRDPVMRAWSEYRMFVKSGHEKGSFADAVRLAVRWLGDPEAAPLCESACRTSFNPVRYVCCGMYGALISRWQEHYPRERMLIAFSEDYFHEPGRFCKSVYSFLGLADFQPPSFPHARVSGDKSQPDPEVAQTLRDFYAPHDEALRKLVGRALPWDYAAA